VAHSSTTDNRTLGSYIENTHKPQLRTFSDLLPIPRGGKRASSTMHEKTKKRKVGHAKLITCSPYKRQLEELKSPKVQKAERTRKNPTSTKRLKRGADTATVCSQEQDRTPCLYCDILYCDSNVSWVMCRRCEGWVCNDCVSGRKSKAFICSSCA